MSNKKSTIHEFDLNVVREYFLNAKQQGPGSPEIDNIPNKIRQMQKAGYLSIPAAIVPDSC